MELMHNSTFRLIKELKPSTPYAPGIYRVILDEPAIDKTVAVLIQSEKEERQTHSGGRKKKLKPKNKRRKPPLPMVGKLLWMDRGELQRLEDEQMLKPIKISRAGDLLVTTLRAKSQAEYEKRLLAMAGFLDHQKLREQILVHEGLGGLVRMTTEGHGVSRFFVYKNWSSICRHGFDPKSLMPRHDKCGAPGVARPCDPGGRKKAGRKTLTQRVALAYGRELDPVQPGMSSEWKAAILAADKQIPTPKPSWPKRCIQIVGSAFIGEGKEVNGSIELVKPALGEYPNDKQIQRVLTTDKTRLERLLERTTKAHFKGSLRGLVARNWQGAEGPNHTWAIDSTVGDVYLRSSINRSWLVGRPIVYIIVDVWSTAIVGFYVCLTGPSWDTAKVSLFNAAADPALLGELWGYEPILTLEPNPTMCYSLMCDRGEYLSHAHRETAMKLIPLTSYAPPYRGDLKGLVEVLHRVEKDAQFLFIPGAMDYRRQELELRRVDPNKSVMTVREYVEFLHELFAEYNLTAPRHHRVDAHMLAAGVYPSPAGLWRWGHAMGIGYRKHIDESDLVINLLPQSTARVRRDAVRFAKCDYSSSEVNAAHWTALARNYGGWNLPVNHYPGSMSTIWTPNVGGTGTLRLHLSDQSKVSPEISFEEYLDSLAVETMRQPEIAHGNKMLRVDFHNRRKAMVERATQLTRDAIERAAGAKPTMTEARSIEVAAGGIPLTSKSEEMETVHTESAVAHRAMMDSLMKALDDEEQVDG